jgi:DNA-binding phage protein
MSGPKETVPRSLTSTGTPLAVVDTGILSTSFYTMPSEAGNPVLSSLTAILKALEAQDRIRE